MALMKHATVSFVTPYIRCELPGWGRIYGRCVGGYEANDYWEGIAPKIIRDKRYGLLRLLDMREWADRSLFFLGRWYELETQMLLDLILRKGDRVLDVGANYGHFSLAAAALVGDTGHVIAVEPNPVSFARLQTHVDLNRLRMIETWNAGLSDAKGELALHIPRINSGEASFAGTKYDDAEVRTCPVFVGDDKLGDSAINFLKIDVEGFEIRVLKGLQKTIARNSPWILTEVVREHLDLDNRVPTDLEDVLRPLGYTPMRLSLTGRFSWQKTLSLRPFDLDKDRGDVLWVPKAQQDVIKNIVSGS